ATNVNPGWALRQFASGPYSGSAKIISNGFYWLNYLNRRDDARGCQLFAIFEKPLESAETNALAAGVDGAVAFRG
ncbi:MAG: hypothetical protein JOZ69_16770, partial [Myxococcales bacterium]|nr:hypothetical protein [Myxococcales bacterium]